jgi:signal transduction histidine kinase
MQLKIWHKMIIGISIPSFIAILGGLLTYGYIADIKSRQAFVQVADDLKELVLEVRRNEKNFLNYKDEEHHGRLRNALFALTSSISNISPATVREMGEDKFSSFNSSVVTYSAIADKLNETFQKEREITREVKAEGEKLENIVATKKFANELSTNFILQIRLLEKNYMFYRDKKSYLELTKGLSQMKNIVPVCYECIPYIKAVQNLSSIYQESELLINDLQKTGDSLEEISWKIAFRERQKINSFITLTQRLLLVALILLCTLGPLFVYKTASYIVAPIKRLSEITQKISEGDISLRAPLKEHDETYSLAVSFNTMLDNLQQMQRSLKESLELLREKQAQLVESEKRASLGFLVAGVAHELNNPLNNISLTAETIDEDLDRLSREELREYIKDILKQSERAHSIVDNLLDFARARRPTTMERLDIVRVVKDSLNLVANQLRVNNIKVVHDLPERAYYVEGNRSKLEQILISLITNAVQAMKDSGTLTITVIPDAENKNIFVKVKDTGQGISEKDIKNIFEPFFTTKPPGEGTGLGLSITRTLVAEHGGEIDVESKIGSGTTFIIKLPLLEETT